MYAIFLYEVKCIFNGFGVGYWGNVCQGNRWIWKVSVIMFNERMSNILYQMRLTFQSDFLFLKCYIEINQNDFAAIIFWLKLFTWIMRYIKGSVWRMFKYTVKSLIFPKLNAIKNILEKAWWKQIPNMRHNLCYAGITVVSRALHYCSWMEVEIWHLQDTPNLWMELYSKMFFLDEFAICNMMLNIKGLGTWIASNTRKYMSYWVGKIILLCNYVLRHNCLFSELQL